MKIAVENYELCNNGILVCKWFDLESDTMEDIVEYFEKALENEGIGKNHMELFVADYKDESGIYSGESVPRAFEVQETIDDLDEDDLIKIPLLVDNGYANSVEEAIEMLDKVISTGETDMSDIAYNYINESGALNGLDETLKGYFNYESYGETMEINGSYVTDNNGYYYEISA